MAMWFLPGTSLGDYIHDGQDFEYAGIKYPPNWDIGSIPGAQLCIHDPIPDVLQYEVVESRDGPNIKYEAVGPRAGL